MLHHLQSRRLATIDLRLRPPRTGQPINAPASRPILAVRRAGRKNRLALAGRIPRAPGPTPSSTYCAPHQPRPATMPGGR